jgi:PleD family two-component response regulator
VQITRVAPSLPVIVLSATADVADKIVLLEIGATDYVTIQPKAITRTRPDGPTLGASGF